MSLVIGIDAGKDTLVIATWPQTGAIEIANTPAAIGRWLEGVAGGACIGIEATGRYHGALADLATSQGHTVYVLNPRDVHYYARGVGQRGKTDRKDAQLIARYVSREKDRLHAYRIPPRVLVTLGSLIRKRASVVVAQVQLRHCLDGDGALAPASDDVLQALEQLKRHIDRQIVAHLQEDPERCERWKRLQTLPGVGPITAALLVTLFERIPFERADALVAFSGLDPRPCDSGHRRGRRVITKRGPPEMRRLLYLAAMAFARSPIGASVYARYRARALSATATYVILARKLLRIAWAVDRTAKPFDPICLLAS